MRAAPQGILALEHGGLLALGMIIGVAAAAPVGPVNVMTVQRSLRYGFMPGLAAGAGSACADVLFAAVAGLGLTAIRTFIDDHARGIQVVGGLLVIAFGARILMSRPRFRRETAEEDGWSNGIVSSAASGFAMTVTNPGAVLGFIALFGALGDWAPDPGDWVGVGELVAGVAVGTLAWWTTVASLATRFRDNLTEGIMARVNLFAGSAMVLFGGLILGRLGLKAAGLV